MTATLAITRPASPAKLRNGSWGARVVLPGSGISLEDLRQELPGQRIEIRTRSGKSWTAEIARVLWTGGDIALVTTNDAHSPRRNSSSSTPRKRLVGTHTSHPCSCGNWGGSGTPCLYSYGEAKDEGEARFIEWERR